MEHNNNQHDAGNTPHENNGSKVTKENTMYNKGKFNVATRKKVVVVIDSSVVLVIFKKDTRFFPANKSKND